MPLVFSLADKQDLLSAAFAASDCASKILSSHFGNLQNVSEKFHAGLVSEADRESESAIVSLLQSRYPAHGFLGEESGLTKGADPVSNWIIDPLDGTTNYVHQFPFFAISIAFEHAGEMLVGVVDAPKMGLRYHAIKGEGAFLNGQPIKVSSRTQWREALFATGFSSTDEDLEHQFELLRMAVQEARGIRRAGAAALDLCFVAQGVFDLFWEKNLASWDTAAGFLIAAEAGAAVTDLSGMPFHPNMPSIVAGTPAIHRRFIETSTALLPSNP